MVLRLQVVIEDAGKNQVRCRSDLRRDTGRNRSDCERIHIGRPRLVVGVPDEELRSARTHRPAPHQSDRYLDGLGQA